MKLRNRKQTSPKSKTSSPKVTVKATPRVTLEKIQDPESSATISKDDELKEKLNKLYTDIKSVPNYSSKITDFLRSNELHSKFKIIKKHKFPRRRVIARFPFEIFMADLIEYQNDYRNNNGYRFILVIIDCFTKMLYAAPMKRKNKESSLHAFEKIFEKFDRYPVNIVTDDGKEFYNDPVQNFFMSYGINHYSTPTKTKTKASIVERVNRTLKEKLEKYFAKTKRRRWLDVLDQFVANYNRIPHRSIGIPPQDVSDQNRDEVYKTMYPYDKLTVVCRLKIGDRVRRKIEKETFEKGYSQRWSDTIYKISSVRQSNAICYYKLEDLEGKEQTGIWYYYQLNLVAKNAD